MITFDHVAVAVHRIGDAMALFRDLLGGVPAERGIGTGFTFQQLTFPAGTVELLEPRGADSFLHRFLHTRGEGLHHITFKVQDLPRWAERLRDAGYRVVGENYDNPEWREAFVHPKSGHGVLIQLAETLPPERGR
ncbi:MAG TPA: VOC family protein [bacterium]|nr:VOC family protein [bacterium]